MKSKIIILCVLLFMGFSVVSQAQDIVCFEAESALSVVAPMRLMEFKSDFVSATNAAVNGASGNKYIEIPKQQSQKSKAFSLPKIDVIPSDKNGSATFMVNIPVEGEYYLWCRTWWTGGCGNSFTIVIDDKRIFTFGEDGTFRAWHWGKYLKTFNLSKGKHTLEIKQRELGAKLDQILFVNHRRYIPVGIEQSSPKKR